ncbi:MAG: hypothetical protein KAW45_00045 [Thermoplasmatales archaeon]|nr:hypothetical protein [Thermoplasmatales archaeon]
MMLVELLLSAPAVAFIIIIFRGLVPTKEKVDKEIQTLIYKIKNISTLDIKEGNKLLVELIPYSKVDGYPEEYLALTSPLNQLTSIEKDLTMPVNEVAEEIVWSRVHWRLGFKFGLSIFGFLTLSLLAFFYFFFRVIQDALIRDGKFLIIESFLPFAIPVGIFAITFCAVIALTCFNEKFYITKLGKEHGSEIYYSISSIDVSKDDEKDQNEFGTKNYWAKRKQKSLRSRKKVLKIISFLLLIFGVVFLIIVSLSIDHYTVVEENGIYHSSWFSIGENFYSWGDFDHIYYEYGRILYDGKTYHPYNSLTVVFIVDDTIRIGLDEYSEEINNQKPQMINFIVNQSELPIEEIIWDRSTDQYIEYSLDMIDNYKIDN